MSLKLFDNSLCVDCHLRRTVGCPVVDSCPVDVWRKDEQGYPVVTYPDDCQKCFLCQGDCPLGAIEITPVCRFPILAY
jgi:NAD-dependent dihydropyrimidine dehydrogenase PreA subunit